MIKVKSNRSGNIYDMVILKEKNEETHRICNLTKGHICTCKFNSYEEALDEIERNTTIIECATKESIKETIKELVIHELERANTIHPPILSNHDGYGVIKEEVEEAEAEIEQINLWLADIWRNVKLNKNSYGELERLKESALDGAYELIQVAAMAEKYITYLKGEKGNE